MKRSLILTVIVSAIPLTGCSSTGTGPSASSSGSAIAGPPSPTGCQIQVTSWRRSSARPELEAVQSDIGILFSNLSTLAKAMTAGDDLSKDEGTVQTSAASLQSDAQTAQTSLTPGCAGNARAETATGLGDSVKTAIDCQDSITSLGTGNGTAALSDLNTAISQMKAATAKFSSAADALDAVAAGNGSAGT